MSVHYSCKLSAKRWHLDLFNAACSRGRAGDSTRQVTRRASSTLSDGGINECFIKADYSIIVLRAGEKTDNEHMLRKSNAISNERSFYFYFVGELGHRINE